MLRVEDGSLVEFSFTSHLAEDTPQDALQRLVRQAWRYNVRAGVTGLLRFAGTGLEQVVEGPSPIILALSARILTDPRHGRIAVRAFGPIAERRFPGWTVEGLGPPPACAFEPGRSRGVLRLLRPAGASRPDAAAPPLAAARAT